MVNNQVKAENTVYVESSFTVSGPTDYRLSVSGMKRKPDLTYDLQTILDKINNAQ